MKKRNIILSIVLIIVAAIAIIVTAIVVNVLNEPKVEISFENSNNIPSGELRKVRENLSSAIRKNTTDFDSNKVYQGAATNYNEEVADEMTTASFIVNFDEIRESYFVSVTWPDSNDGSPNLMIACALLDGKYPETPCETEANSSFDIVSYLPYTGLTDAGESYTVNAEYNNDGELYLDIKTDGDAEKTLMAAKSWISGLGFDANELQYFVKADKYIQTNNANTSDENVNQNLPYFLPNMFKVYPVVDNGVVSTIKAEIAGCTDAQTDEAEAQILEYLNAHGINYPVEFEYCAV